MTRRIKIALRRSPLSGSVHTKPEKFENATLFLRLGLPSTLIRHESAALFLRLAGPTVPTNPSRKRSFSETLLKPEEFENAGFLFSGLAIVSRLNCFSVCERETFFLRVGPTFSNFSGVVWTRPQ